MPNPVSYYPNPPPSPIQPKCPFFSYPPSSRPKAKSTASKQTKAAAESAPEETAEEFHRTYGVDGKRKMDQWMWSPYYQGVPGWRIFNERNKGREGDGGVMMMMREDWLDKYRPRALKDFICHRDQALLLRDQVAQGVGGHFIFSGPPGVGKKTMVWALLREAFGPEMYLKTREEGKDFETKGEDIPSIKVNVAFSPKHVEIDLSKLNGYEKHVITALVKEKHTIATECNHADSRAIVLYRSDQLCMDTQNYIRWIMEQHQKCHSILFCCSDVSNLELIRPICTVIELQPPSNDKIVEVLEHIAEKEGIEMPHQLAQTIALNSTQNLRQAIRSFESSSQEKHNSPQIIEV